MRMTDDDLASIICCAVAIGQMRPGADPDLIARQLIGLYKGEGLVDLAQRKKAIERWKE